jgi:predicted phage gp36 major capsid-like protein
MTEAATQPWAAVRDQLAASYEEAKGHTGETLEEFQRRGWCAAAAALIDRPIARLTRNQQLLTSSSFHPAGRTGSRRARTRAPPGRTSPPPSTTTGKRPRGRAPGATRR